MLTSGDVIDVDLGVPAGSEAGLLHPAIVVTAQRILDALPAVIQIVPLTTTIRAFGSEVQIQPDPTNGLTQVSAVQCQHVRAVSTSRTATVRGNIGPVTLAQIRETIALILDIPA